MLHNVILSQEPLYHGKTVDRDLPAEAVALGPVSASLVATSGFPLFGKGIEAHHA
jgi:hypothetical protein